MFTKTPLLIQFFEEGGINLFWGGKKMIRKGILSKLFLVLCISLLLPFVLGHGNVLADNYYVNAVLGTDGPSYGGLPSVGAWKTITYALIQVSGSVGNPATINVAAGTYNPTLGEVFPLNMEDYVSLQGDGQETTIIDADDTYGGVITSDSVNDYSIGGFTIQNGHAGVFNNNSSPTITNCTFSGNRGGDRGFGGGIVNNDSSSPTITNCTFSGNSALYGGGMCNLNSSSPTITNCTFSGNSALFGGGMCNLNSSSPTITNCTFSGNSAGYGGGILNSSPTITNCILWGNTADEGSEIYNLGSLPTVSYCDIDQDGYAGSNGNIRQDPLFVNGSLGEYYLSQILAGQEVDSPCVDAGSDTAVNLNMNDKITRTDCVPDSGVVDMGYHYPVDACDLCPTLRIFGENSEETEFLRNIRDEVLRKTPEGQELIRLYYQWSPVIVQAIEEDEGFKEGVKKMIDGILPLLIVKSNK